MMSSVAASIGGRIPWSASASVASLTRQPRAGREILSYAASQQCTLLRRPDTASGSRGCAATQNANSTTAHKATAGSPPPQRKGEPAANGQRSPKMPRHLAVQLDPVKQQHRVLKRLLRRLLHDLIVV